jgi:hypothetical protein
MLLFYHKNQKTPEWSVFNFTLNFIQPELLELLELLEPEQLLELPVLVPEC